MPEDERDPLEFYDDHERMPTVEEQIEIRILFADFVNNQASYDGEFDHYPFNLGASALLKTN